MAPRRLEVYTGGMLARAVLSLLLSAGGALAEDVPFEAVEAGEPRSSVTEAGAAEGGGVAAVGAGLGSSAPEDAPPRAKPASAPAPAAASGVLQLPPAALAELRRVCVPPQPRARCAVGNFWDGGRCIDPQALIARGAPYLGWSLDQWRTYVLALAARVSPLSTPESLAAMEPDLVAHGVSLQRNSAGELRGRIFLPNGDPEAFWTRGVDIIGTDWCAPWGWAVRH